jgi:hypothetical protein
MRDKVIIGAGVDISDEGMYVVITKTNQFNTEVVAHGWIDELIRRGAKWRIGTMAISQNITREQYAKLLEITE